MNCGTLSQNNHAVAEKLLPAKNLVRLLAVLAALTFGSFSALAAPPVLTLPASVTVGEDTTTDVNIGVSDGAVAIFTVTTTAKSSNTNLVSNASLAMSGSGTNRLLSISPGLHKSGTATITVIATDSQPSSTTNTFSLTVTATNYPPVFLQSIGNLTQNENARSANLSFSISDIETPASNLIVAATSSNTSLVASNNLVLSGTGSNRTLTLTQATNQNGTTLIQLIVTDGGGAKATNNFVLNVLPVNQAPTFTMSTNRVIYDENFGPVTYSNFMSGVSSGPTNQASESNYFVLNYTTNFFTQAPSVNTNGTLTFQVATNLFGTNTITFVLFNSGPTTNGGKNSLTNTLTLDVPFVNQAPSFTLSTNALLVNEETLAVTNIGFLTNVSAGPSNESSQTWTFTTTTATNSATNVVFTVLPAIATNGTLTFHPAAHSYGTNLVTVVMTDSGGTNNGGINIFSNSFAIEVAQTNHAPVIVVATNFTVLENGTTNLTASVNVWDYDTQSSNIVLAAISTNTNVAGVSITGTNVASATNAVFTITFAPVTNANGTATIQLVASEGSLSTTNTTKLTITPVNQAPSFTLSTNALLVNEETLAVTNIGFLTNLSAGPSNESSQTWTFTTTTSTNSATNVVFTALPVIATNGTLTFHPAAHSYGTNRVTVVMTDSGGTNNGGINIFSNSFAIEVAQTNHAPVIVVATNFTVLENGTTNLTASVNVWDYDTQSSNIVLAAISTNTNVAGVSITGTNVASATNVVFTLTFAPVTNANGTATIQLVASEGSLSTTNTTKLTITPVNQAPSFTLSTNALLVNEETLAVTNIGFLTNVSAGPSNESSQTWTFTTTTATNSATNVVFTVLPAIATNGTLTFHPAAHSYGTNLVTVVMTDSGGTNNGGINIFSNSFAIEVAQTNHAPVIVVATNFTVLENGTTNLTASVNVWDYDTQSSNIVLAAISTNTNVAGVSITGTNVASATNAVFTITFAPVTNANGTATIQLVASEGSLSTTNTTKLTITPVNQAPSFTLSTNALLVNEETLAVTNIGFLTNLSAGPSNESSQTWTFTTTTSTNSATNVVFTALPVIATNGTLTFHPAAHSYGTNRVTVVMTDSGGTNNGGINIFSNSFAIEVAQTNHAPVIVVATNFTVLENGTTNLTASVNVWDYDTQSSNIVLAAISTNTNVAGVSITGTNVASATNVVFTLTFAPVTNANGTATIQLVASEGSLSTTNTTKLTITPVNQAPSFTLSTNALLVNEETLAVTNIGFLTNVSAGPSNESSQTWTFTTTTATNSATNVVFTVLPAIATNGTLTFHPAAHSYGTNLVTVVMTDSGGTNNGGINIFSNSFAIEVAQTNHAPVIVVATNFTVLENGTTNLTASVNVWDYDTQSSNIVLAAISTNTNVAGVSITGTNVASATNAVFTITFAPVTNANGTATIQLVASEGSLSTTNTTKLTITPVNQAPSFTLSTNALLVNEETLAVTNIGFLTNLSAGPSNESSQTWTFTTTTATNSATNVVFTVLPAIATNGTLTFHPAAHSYGTNRVTVVMTDSGGTNNGGINIFSNSFAIEVAQTNHAPVIVVATNFTVLENGTTNLTASVNVWDYDTQSSNIVLAAISTNTNVAGVSITGTNVASATNVVFTITFAPVTNANGTATIQLVASEGSLSTTNTTKLTITPVNQAPSFTLSTNALLVNEETLAVTNIGFLTNLNAGPSNESSQTWTFTTTTSTNSATNVVFTALPVIATNGTLTFHPAAHSYGTNRVTVVMTDSGGTNNGGINIFSNSFAIEVAQTNHAPVIVVATNFTVLENGTTNLTASVNVWDYDTQSSNIVLAAISTNTNVAGVSITGTNVASATNAVFTITFAPVTNANGTSTIQLVASEGSLSTTNTTKLTITPVNQAPSFTLSTNALLVNEETLAVTNIGFLTNLSAGPSNESSQTWTFTTTTATNSATNVVFTVLPAIATNGTLTFHPAAHSYGTNLVTVVMTDSGGTNNGGINIFSNSFAIEVAQTNHAPVIVVATNFTVLENGTTNLTASVNVWDYDTQSSNIVLAAISTNTNVAGVSITGTNVASATNVVFTLTFAPVTNANGTATIQLVASEGSLSTTNTTKLTITPVNQAPSFTLSTNALLVNEETLAVTNIGFLTNLSAGPSNESSQTWTFTTTTATNSATNVVFTALPVIATNGTLTFHPAAHSYGTNRVTVVMTDSGGTNNGGINIFSNSFAIEVAQTNHAPVIVVATNFTVLENGTTNLTASVNVWDYDTQSSNLVLAAISSNTNLAGVSVTGTNVASATNAVFTITLAPVTNANGSGSIQLVATEGSLSTTNTVSLTVTPVNQAPSYSFSTNDVVSNILTVAENAGVTTYSNFLTGMSAGPSNEISQTWSFTVFTPTNSATNATFSQFPTISTNGTLVFKTATNSFGTNSVTVVMTDSGGTNNGGINAYSNSFRLDVTQVPYPPAFTGITNKTMLENATTNVSLAFTLYDPLTTNFTVTAVSSNTNLVTVTVGGTGTARTLLFAPVTNQNGSTTITVTADDGSLTNSTNLTVTITPVNQPPSFNLAQTSITVNQYDVAVSIPNALTNILAGPTNESSQTVGFIVTNSSPGSFLVPPSVSSNGTLAFTPAAQGATVTVGIKAVDSGGTNNGGVNTSAVQTLTIVIPPNAFAYLTGPFAGLFFDTNAPANASSGYFSLVLASNGTFSGHILCAGNSNTFTGQFGITNSAATVAASNYTMDLIIDTTGSWTESVSGTVSNTTATWNAELLSYLAGYSASFPTPLAGDYLMAMPGFGDPTAGPAGDSVFSLFVSNSGAISLSGYMADNTYASQVSQLSTSAYYPLYVPLYGNGSDGSLIGWINITGALSNSVSPSSTLMWFNEPGATALYPGGFTNQSLPLAALYSTNVSDLLSFSSGSVILAGGNLATPITNAVTISANLITVDPSATNGLSLTIDRSTGEISGTFLSAGRTNSIDSVILQNSTNVVRGYFLGTNESGSFILFGD